MEEEPATSSIKGAAFPAEKYRTKWTYNTQNTTEREEESREGRKLQRKKKSSSRKRGVTDLTRLSDLCHSGE